MDTPDYRVTSVLTEHLGFAPPTLIDEIINAVNQIMYNCTDALENFLKQRRNAQLEAIYGENIDSELTRRSVSAEDELNAEAEGKVFPLSEIEHGTAELETLMVSHVDKNFDKFELFTLRNILTIPNDLVDSGWIRLRHQDFLASYLGLDSAREDENLKLPPNIRSTDSDDEKIFKLKESIKFELHLRKLLKFRLLKLRKLQQFLVSYKEAVLGLVFGQDESQLPADLSHSLNETFAPINENTHYLLRQASEFLQQVMELNEKFARNEPMADVANFRFPVSSRDHYIAQKTRMVFDKIGLKSTDIAE